MDSRNMGKRKYVNVGLSGGSHEKDGGKARGTVRWQTRRRAVLLDDQN